MSLLIMPYKTGKCSVCGEEDTEVRKRKKDLICIRCCKDQDNKKQMQKVSLKTRVRTLGTTQKDSGNFDSANRANILQDLDYTASRIVRLRAAGDNLLVQCYTCPTVAHFSMMDCSHFISRSCMLLRWDINRNLKPACKKCNQHEYGNLESFAKHLNEEQEGLSELLKEESREVHKWSLDELKGLLFDLRQKLKPLEAKIKKPNTSQPI